MTVEALLTTFGHPMGHFSGVHNTRNHAACICASGADVLASIQIVLEMTHSMPLPKRMSCKILCRFRPHIPSPAIGDSSVPCSEYSGQSLVITHATRFTVAFRPLIFWQDLSHVVQMGGILHKTSRSILGDR